MKRFIKVNYDCPLSNIVKEFIEKDYDCPLYSVVKEFIEGNYGCLSQFLQINLI